MLKRCQGLGANIEERSRPNGVNGAPKVGLNKELYGLMSDAAAQAMKRICIGLIGDYDAEKSSHQATDGAIVHAADALGISIEATWVPTDLLEAEASNTLQRFDGLWCAPGSPYRSLKGALEGVRFARESHWPFFGTCGGFQHTVLEYARNVLGFRDAAHAEYDPYASNLFVSRLECSLKGKTMRVQLQRGSRAFDAYQGAEANEQYFCDFGLTPANQSLIHEGGLRTTGIDQDGETRIVELPSHRHFLATLFVPQISSQSNRPHPLIIGFLTAAMIFAEARTARLTGRITRA